MLSFFATLKNSNYFTGLVYIDHTYKGWEIFYSLFEHLDIIVYRAT